MDIDVVHQLTHYRKPEAPDPALVVLGCRVGRATRWVRGHGPLLGRKILHEEAGRRSIDFPRQPGGGTLRIPHSMDECVRACLGHRNEAIKGEGGVDLEAIELRAQPAPDPGQARFVGDRVAGRYRRLIRLAL